MSLNIKIIIRGKVVPSPSLGHNEFCESVFNHGSFVFAHGLSMHQTCFNYALTNLLFSLCRFV
jgi:hypothetical protein